MKIAIIENDQSFVRELKNSINNPDWNIEFFADSAAFGLSDIKQFDMIIASYDISDISGKEVLNSIKDKTQAEMYLMSDDQTIFLDANQEHIKGFVTHKTAEAIIDKLQYTEVKLNINGLIKKEDKKYTEIINNINGYSFEICDNIIFIGITKTLSNLGKENLFDKIIDSKMKKAIISYPGKESLSTNDCGQIFDISNFFKDNSKKLIFVNIEKNAIIRDTIELFKLDKLIPVFDEIDDAIHYLT